LKAFYDAHPEEFMTGPQRKIRYILYQTNTFAETVQPSEAEIKAYYEANRDKSPYFQQERARVRHILIKNEGRTSEQAKELALSVQASLAAGKSFEDLVAAHSEDQVSKGRQGDLGVFTRGQYTASYGEAFDKMAFSLGEGQVSEPFESSQGWHLVRMENHFPEIRQSLEEANESIVKVLKNEKGKTQAQAKAAEFHSQVSGGKSFAEAAGSLGATLQESDFFDMNNASIISTELGAHIKIKNSAFAAKEKDKGAELLDVGIGFTIFQFMDEREPVKLEFEATNYRIKQAAEQAKGRQILSQKAEELAAYLRSASDVSLEELRQKFPFLNESNARTTNPFGSTNMPFQLARTELSFENLYAQEKGAIVGPVKGKENPNDMYLLRLTDKTQPDPEGFAAARAGLIDQLRQERFTDLMESTLLGMKARLDPTGARYAKIQDALLTIK
jgi:peptidyl-prolyl cis-trans isomerase D